MVEIANIVNTYETETHIDYPVHNKRVETIRIGQLRP